MGWEDNFSERYMLRFWEGAAEKQEALRWVHAADVVVQGRFPMAYVRPRIKANALTFAYQERFWKRSPHLGRLVARLPRIYRRYWSLMKRNHHLLAAGAFVAQDLNQLGCFRGQAWKFGYFLDAAELPAPRAESNRIELLWCARFSPVKRPQDALTILQGLISRGVDCHLTMIGDGTLKAQIELQAKSLAGSVSFLGWQPAAAVAEHMRKADALLMTSGFGDGWGMVINEAQNCACAVIANCTVGAAPWMIQQDETGLLYQQDQITSLVNKLSRLGRDRLHQIGLAGFQSHRHNWSAAIAAKRLLRLSEALIENDVETAHGLFRDGPCSVA